MKKNTRLFYNDEKSLNFWQTLPAETGYKLFLACLEYKYQEGNPERLNDDPIATALFLQVKEKIDYNEAKWANDKRRITSVENGKKGGKHKKDMEQEFTAELEAPETDCMNDTGISVEEIGGPSNYTGIIGKK